MKYNRLILLFAVGFLCVSMFGCAGGSRRVVLDDQTIALQIKDQLEATSGPEGPFEIDVIVDAGEVTLDGEVPTPLAKEKAIEITQITEGVKDVKSYLIVRQPSNQ